MPVSATSTAKALSPSPRSVTVTLTGASSFEQLRENIEAYQEEKHPKACVACKRCEKACQFDAIHVEMGFALIDNVKCTRCGECVKVCPMNCICRSQFL